MSDEFFIQLGRGTCSEQGRNVTHEEIRRSRLTIKVGAGIVVFQSARVANGIINADLTGVNIALVVER